jgi:hypothetical protein
LRETLDLVQPKTAVARALTRAGRQAVKTVTDALSVARSNLPLRQPCGASRRRGHPVKPEAKLLAEIKQTIAGQPDLQISLGARVDPATSPRI